MELTHQSCRLELLHQSSWTKIGHYSHDTLKLYSRKSTSSVLKFILFFFKHNNVLQFSEHVSMFQTSSSTVAHNCHIKTKCSHQIQITHIKFKLLTANYKSTTANYKSFTSNTNRSHQLQIAHSKYKYGQCKKRGRTADCGLRTADCGLRTADCGLRTADCGLRTADCGLQTAEQGKKHTEGKMQTTD